jgi:hypothetical protein
MINCKNNKTENEYPAENKINQTKKRNRQLYFCIQLGYHSHLTSISHIHIFHRIFKWAEIIMMEPSLFKSTFCFLFFSTNPLISECQIHRRYTHKLHWKCKHHQYNKNANNTQCLWHRFPFFNFVNLQAKDTYTNFNYAV